MSAGEAGHDGAALVARGPVGLVERDALRRPGSPGSRDDRLVRLLGRRVGDERQLAAAAPPRRSPRAPRRWSPRPEPRRRPRSPRRRRRRRRWRPAPGGARAPREQPAIRLHYSAHDSSLSKERNFYQIDRLQSTNSDRERRQARDHRPRAAIVSSGTRQRARRRRRPDRPPAGGNPSRRWPRGRAPRPARAAPRAARRRGPAGTPRAPRARRRARSPSAPRRAAASSAERPRVRERPARRRSRGSARSASSGPSVPTGSETPCSSARWRSNASCTSLRVPALDHLGGDVRPADARRARARSTSARSSVHAAGRQAREDALARARATRRSDGARWTRAARVPSRGR